MDDSTFIEDKKQIDNLVKRIAEIINEYPFQIGFTTIIALSIYGSKHFGIAKLDRLQIMDCSWDEYNNNLES